MAHTTFADRVKETTTTTGTGTINLGGAVSGYQTFVDGLGNGHYTYYSIFHQSANEWEVGLGLVTDAATDTLSRDTVLSSSNGGSLVNFSAGTKDVICTMPASKSVIIDGDSNISVTANMTATSFAGSGAALTSLNATNVASGTLDDARLTGNVVLVSGATFTGNVSLGDNDYLRLGDSQDLLIYHDASDSVIRDAGTGNLVLASTNLRMSTADRTESYIQADANGEVRLYYDNAEKLNTSVTGVDITGTATATTFSGSGASLTTLNASNVSSGTLDSARLSGDVVLTSGATFTGNVAFGDLDFINMGPTGEFQIYHDHANGVSNIKDVDAGGSINIEADTISLTGNATLSANTGIGTTADRLLQLGSTQSVPFAMHRQTATNSASVAMYFQLGDGAAATNKHAYAALLGVIDDNTNTSEDGSFVVQTSTNGTLTEYLKVNSAGIDVTGTVVSDGLTVDTNTLYVDSTNNRVGIGTSSPSENLHIYSSGAPADVLIESTTAGQDARLFIRRNGSSSRGYLNFYDSSTSANWYTGLLRTTSTSFAIGQGDDFGTNTRLVIDSSGDVGIGTTSPSTILHVDSGSAGTTNAEAGILIDGTRAGVVYNLISNNDSNAANRGSGMLFQSGGFDTAAIIARSDATAASGDAPGYITFHTSADNTENLTERMRINSSGTVSVTGAITATGDITAFYTSDESLKTNIEKIQNPMEKVMELNGVYYNWTQEAQDKHSHLGEEKEIGVIAQQVEKVLPEMVSTRDDGTKAVRYERMCALLIECVKDLQNQVNELKGVK